MFILGFVSGIIAVGLVVVMFMTVDIIKEWWR